MFKNESLLSIIIPTYGRVDKIGNAINSCSDPRIDIIIVDDNGLGSPMQKETEKYIKSIAEIHKSRITYFPMNFNQGACVARNKGIEIANTDLVTFLDDDDFILIAETIAKSEYMINNPNIDVCCSNMLSSYAGKYYNLDFCRFSGIDASTMLTTGNCYTPMIMARKNKLLEIGGFDNCKKYQDHNLMLKIHINKLVVNHYDKVTFVHNDHDENRITNSKISYSAMSLRFKNEYRLLNILELSDDEYLNLKNVIDNRKKLLCLYYLVLPKFDSHKKVFFSSYKYLSNNIRLPLDKIIFISLLQSLKCNDFINFKLKKLAYSIKNNK